MPHFSKKKWKNIGYILFHGQEKVISKFFFLVFFSALICVCYLQTHIKNITSCSFFISIFNNFHVLYDNRTIFESHSTSVFKIEFTVCLRPPIEKTSRAILCFRWLFKNLNTNTANSFQIILQNNYFNFHVCIFVSPNNAPPGV